MSKIDISLVARQYVANGWALVPIPSGSKGPNTAGWNRPENCVRTPEACSRVKDNVGLAHKYSRTCVLDFDDLVKSAAWLSSQGLDFDSLWNAPDAVRISSGRPNRGKLLFKLPDGVAALRSHSMHDFGLELRCASHNGMTLQDVLPPSIHPDTGAPYEWDFADPVLGDWRSPPVLPAAVLAVWRTLSVKAQVESEGGEEGGEYNEEATREILEQFDPNTGYHEWIEVGMALHHEFCGADEGLDLWDEWSAAGDSYSGYEDLEYHWRSFDYKKTGPKNTLDSLRAIIRARPTSPDEFQMLVDSELEDEPAKAGMEQAAPPAPQVIDPADDFEDLGPADQQQVAAPKKRPFAFESTTQFMQRPPLTWIVKGFLPKAVLAILYGASGSGKTFLALDLALSIARGENWRGARTTQGGVAYVVAEGAGGFRDRLAAYCQDRALKPADLPLHLLGAAPDLMNDKAASVLGAELVRCGPLSVVFIDTYARVMSGNENEAKDTNKIVSQCYNLHKVTGAIIVLVHHTGKDETRGARGSGALRAAADVELEVIRTNQYRAVKVAKMKDGRDGGEFKFKLNDVVIGWDDDDDEVTSCVVEHITEEANAMPEAPKAKGPVQARILDLLGGIIGGDIEREAFISMVKDNTPMGASGKQDPNWKKKITDPLKKLIAEGLVVEVAGFLSLPNSARE